MGLLITTPAFAYVGPGAGISLLGALWGLVIGVVAAIGIILFWPVRVMLRKRKAAREATAVADAHDAGQQANSQTPQDDTQEDRRKAS